MLVPIDGEAAHIVWPHPNRDTDAPDDAADLEPVESQPCPTCRLPVAVHDVHGRCPNPGSGDPQTHVPGQMPLPLT